MVILAAEIAVVGGEALRRLPAHPLDRRGLHPVHQRGHEHRNDLVLDGEHVGNIAFERSGPHVAAGQGVDEVNGQTDPAARSPGAAADDVVDAELPPDHPNVGLAAPERVRGQGGDDEQRR